jgi:hypothetical protein
VFPLVVLIGGILFIGVALVKPWGNDQPPASAALGSASPSNVANQPPATPSDGASPAGGSVSSVARSDAPTLPSVIATPVGDATGCEDDRVTLSAARPMDDPRPVRLPPISAARTGRAAFVEDPATKAPTRRLVVVAGHSGAKAVAVVTSPAVGAGVPWARVREWSRDGAALLVEVGRFSPVNPLHNCGDLYLVTVDGPTVTALTHNDPGQTAISAAFAAGDHSIVYLEAQEDATGASATLRQTDADGHNLGETLPCRVEAPFYPVEGSLVVSPDGALLAVQCPSNVLTYNPATNEAAAILAQPASRMLGSIAWARDSRSVVAVVEDSTTDPPGTLWQQSDWRGDRTLTRNLPQKAWALATGIQLISPDATRVILPACVANGRPNPCIEQLWVVMPDTGEIHLVLSSPDLGVGASWLPGGSAIDVAEIDGPTYRAVDRPNVRVPIDVPPDAAWWTPPTR